VGTRRTDPGESPQVTALRQLPTSIRGLVKTARAQGDPLTWTVRQIPGGFKALLRLLELSPHDPEAQRVCEAYRRVKAASGNQHVTISEVVEDAAIAPRDFIGLISKIAYDFNVTLGKTILAVQYPAIMKASVRRALQDEATEERKIHFQASQYLPTGKGIQIGIANNTLSLPDDRPPAPGKPASFDRTARQIVRDLPPGDR
jgi:hypothetical protein